MIFVLGLKNILWKDLELILERFCKSQRWTVEDVKPKRMLNQVCILCKRKLISKETMGSGGDESEQQVRRRIH